MSRIFSWQGFTKSSSINLAKQTMMSSSEVVRCFINDAIDQFYLGVEPAGGPPPLCQLRPILPMHEGIVSFSEPGTYLVICNVRGHFNDAMFGYVEVD